MCALTGSTNCPADSMFRFCCFHVCRLQNRSTCCSCACCAGVDNGSLLRLNGQGDVGTFGGKRGDIILRFVVSLAGCRISAQLSVLSCHTHAFHLSRSDNGFVYLPQIHPEDSFSRKGSDVYSTVPISYTDAILGRQLDVQTLRGITAIELLPGTQHDTTLRLSGQGVQVWGATSPTFGAHYVTLHVVLPLLYTAEEQYLLEQLRGMSELTNHKEQPQDRVANESDTRGNVAAACAA